MMAMTAGVMSTQNTIHPGQEWHAKNARLEVIRELRCALNCDGRRDSQQSIRPRHATPSRSSVAAVK